MSLAQAGTGGGLRGPVWRRRETHGEVKWTGPGTLEVELCGAVIVRSRERGHHGGRGMRPFPGVRRRDSGYRGESEGRGAAWRGGRLMQGRAVVK